MTKTEWIVSLVAICWVLSVYVAFIMGRIYKDQTDREFEKWMRDKGYL